MDIKEDSKNYRGFSLLIVWCKINAKILNEKLETYAETLLMEPQNGFRSV
jgi:hypothetical protein